MRLKTPLLLCVITASILLIPSRTYSDHVNKCKIHGGYHKHKYHDGRKCKKPAPVVELTSSSSGSSPLTFIVKGRSGSGDIKIVVDDERGSRVIDTDLLSKNRIGVLVEVERAYQYYFVLDTEKRTGFAAADGWFVELAPDNNTLLFMQAAAPTGIMPKEYGSSYIGCVRIDEEILAPKSYFDRKNYGYFWPKGFKLGDSISDPALRSYLYCSPSFTSNNVFAFVERKDDGSIYWVQFRLAKPAPVVLKKRVVNTRYETLYLDEEDSDGDVLYLYGRKGDIRGKVKIDLSDGSYTDVIDDNKNELRIPSEKVRTRRIK